MIAHLPSASTTCGYVGTCLVGQATRHHLVGPFFRTCPSTHSWPLGTQSCSLSSALSVEDISHPSRYSAWAGLPRIDGDHPEGLPTLRDTGIKYAPLTPLCNVCGPPDHQPLIPSPSADPEFLATWADQASCKHPGKPSSLRTLSVPQTAVLILGPSLSSTLGKCVLGNEQLSQSSANMGLSNNRKDGTFNHIMSQNCAHTVPTGPSTSLQKAQCLS